MEIFKNIVLLLFLTVMISCERTIEFKGTNEDDKIVVNSILVSENDTFEIDIYKSLFVLAHDSLIYIENAEIELYVNDVKQNDIKELNPGKFIINNANLKEGDQLNLIVSAPSYQSVQTSTYIPSNVPINSCKFVNKNSPDIYYDDSVTYFTINIDDPPEESNFYEINLYKTGKYYHAYDDYEYNLLELDIDSEDPVLNEYYSWYNDGLYFDDKLINGKNYNLIFYAYQDIDTAYHDTIIVELRSLSKELFLYRTSFYKQLDAQDNPFAQPVQVFSNVEEGAGIFAGYSATRILID